MEEKLYYLTIAGIDRYAGPGALRPGMRLIMKKEHTNPYDDEAIRICGPEGTLYGYAANSVHSVCRGTHSAGYLQHLFEETAECTVKFVSEDFAIALMENG